MAAVTFCCRKPRVAPLTTIVILGFLSDDGCFCPIECGVTMLPCPEEFTDNAELVVMLVEIVMALVEEFGIGVKEESSQNITTMQEVADLIEKLVLKKLDA